MDDFDVRAQSSAILSTSPLVDELAAQSHNHRSFPVIIDGLVRTFHEIRGGYDDVADEHLVKLVQYHDNMASEPSEMRAGVYEIHLDDSFLLYADDYHTFENEEELVLCIGVNDFDKQAQAFREQMQSDITDEIRGYNWVQ